jgi:hypothetical protein
MENRVDNPNVHTSSLNMNDTPNQINDCNRIYVLIKNPSPSNNLGPFLRCCAAFAVYQVIFIGYEKCSVDGSHGASKHMNVIAFPTVGQAAEYLKECGVVSIVGILGDVGFKSKSGMDYDTRRPIALDTGSSSKGDHVVKPVLENDDVSMRDFPMSHAVHTRPFEKDEKSICFIMDKKAIGLPYDLAQICSSFVHIVSHAPVLEEGQNAIYGLIDSQTCLSITLHYYCGYVGYSERDFSGQKFQVDQRKRLEGSKLEHARLKRRLEKDRLQQEATEGFEDGEFLNLFG